MISRNADIAWEVILNSSFCVGNPTIREFIRDLERGQNLALGAAVISEGEDETLMFYLHETLADISHATIDGRWNHALWVMRKAI